jgi:hypothetical protein
MGPTAERNGDLLVLGYHERLHAPLGVLLSPVDDPTREECLDTAFFLSDVCMDQQIGD